MEFIFLIILEIIGNKYGNILYFNDKEIIFTYLSQENSQSKIIQFLKTIPSISLLFIWFWIYYKILFEFSAIHSLLIDLLLIPLKKAYEMSGSPSGINILIFFISLIFLFMSILIYLEIIVFNFCGLNENTRENILMREKFQNIKDESEKESKGRESRIEISKGYLIDPEYFNNKMET